MRTPARRTAPALAALAALAAPAASCTVATYQPQPAYAVAQPQPVAVAAAGGACTATLVVYGVHVQPSCTVDVRVSRAPGTLQYPCGGGPAEATFGDSVFRGQVDAAGNVRVQIETAFPFSDGCNWTTKQTIEGALASGALAYRYEEAPVAGQRGCASSCQATATVRVQ